MMFFVIKMNDINMLLFLVIIKKLSEQQIIYYIKQIVLVSNLITSLKGKCNSNYKKKFLCKLPHTGQQFIKSLEILFASITLDHGEKK